MILFLLTTCALVVCNGFEGNRQVDLSGDEISEDHHDKVGIMIRHERGVNAELVDIARFIDKSPVGKTYSIYVDDTMERLVFQVTVEGSNPMINVTKPTGKPCLVQPSVVTNSSLIAATLDIPLNSSSDFGNWSFTRFDNNTWNVIVQGKSPVYMEHEFFEIGSNTSLAENVFANNRYRLVLTVHGLQNIRTVETGLMFSKTRKNLRKLVTLMKIGEELFEASNTSILSEIFYVGIQGKDNSSNVLQRIDPTEIKPILFRIYVYPETGVNIYENTTLNVTFMISSYKSAYTMVSINDTMGLAQGSKTMTFSLRAGQNVSGTFVLEAGNIKDSSIVTIMIRYRQGRTYIDGPMVQRIFTVVSNQTVSSEDTGTSNTGSSTAAIAGGISGALIVVTVGVIIGFVLYKKFGSKINLIKHTDETDVK